MASTQTVKNTEIAKPTLVNAKPLSSRSESERKKIAVSRAKRIRRRNRNSIPLLLQDTCRRVFDILAALALLSMMLPIMLIVAIAIRISSPGPAIYLQRRLTKGGKVFTIFKFRSMAATAEKDSGAVMAAAGDMRVTGLGRFIRKTRLDELPQLINVMIGDMSFIGPRPERPELARKLEEQLPDMPRRLEVNAGLTGLAQIKAGYASCPESYRKKLDLDIFYVENRSLLMDLKILIETVVVVFTGRGAR